MTLPKYCYQETSKGQLLQQFCWRAGNALLVATSSFWEGGGRARRYVIFGDWRQIAVYLPGDPMLKREWKTVVCAVARSTLMV